MAGAAGEVEVVWEVQLPAPPAAGGVADDSRIYVPLEGQIVALSRDGGGRVWSRDLDSAWPPSVDGELLLVTTRDALHALHAETGATQATVPLPSPPAGPMARAGGVMVVSLADGRLLTARDDVAVLEDLGAPSRERPAVSGGAACDLVVVALEDGRLVAEGCGGAPGGWSRNVGGTLTAPTITGDRVLVGSTDGRFYAFDARDGRLEWHWSVGNDVVGAAVSGDRIFVVSLDNIVRALDRDSGNLRWQQVLPTRPVAPPFLTGGRLFVPGVRPALLSYDALTGTPLESLDLPARYSLALLAGSPLVLAGDGPGAAVVAVMRDGYVLGLRRAPVDGPGGGDATGEPDGLVPSED